MIPMKTFFLLTLLSLFTSNDDRFNIVEDVLHFMEISENGAPITSESCLNNPVFKTTKISIEPKEIIKGQSIKIKVGGVMLQDTQVNKLHLVTYFNGEVIFTDNVDKKNVPVKKGTLYSYDYEAAVPAFTPSGKWEIFLHLQDPSGKDLNCLKASFTMT